MRKKKKKVEIGKFFGYLGKIQMKILKIVLHDVIFHAKIRINSIEIYFLNFIFFFQLSGTKH